MDSSRKSTVGSHFVKDESAERTQCNYCKMWCSCKMGSTSNLTSHLRTQHPLQFVQTQSRRGSSEQSVDDPDSASASETQSSLSV